MLWQNQCHIGDIVELPNLKEQGVVHRILENKLEVQLQSGYSLHIEPKKVKKLSGKKLAKSIYTE